MTDATAAAVTFRVLMAGTSTEHAVNDLRGGRVGSGQKWVADAIHTLAQARDYLEAVPALSFYLERVEARITFLEGILEQIRYGAPPDQIALTLFNGQGDLWDASPLGGT